MERKSIKVKVVDGGIKEPRRAVAPHVRTRRFGAAFWLDWAPIIVLGIAMALAGITRLGMATGAAPSAPTAIVETGRPAPAVAAEQPRLPGNTLAERGEAELNSDPAHGAQDVRS